MQYIILAHRQTGFPLQPYLRLLALLLMTSCFSLMFCIFARGFGWAPGWRLLFGTLLGWASMAVYTWRYLFTEGERGYILAKMRHLLHK